MEQTLSQRYLAVKRDLFDTVFGRYLNYPQCQAVFTTENPLLVLAGAGSGKTTVLVKRISFIIRYGNAYFDDFVPSGIDEAYVQELEEARDTLPAEDIEAYYLPRFVTSTCPPWAILAITFTNKAAREIKERLAHELGNDDVAKEIVAGTFHSVCVRFLRRWGDLLGYRPGFTIYDADDSKRLISAIMKELNISEKVLSPKLVCNAISAAKDKLIAPADFPIEGSPRNRDIRRIYETYQARLMEYNALDFDDLIFRTVELLENHEEPFLYYTRKFRYVCVDEYQDTNHAQFRLTQLLASGRNNIMVVGDDDQSIYRFRGATIENILSFDRVYQNCRVIKLEQNYRSTKTILKVANAVIQNNDDRHQKALWCEAEEGEKIYLHRAEDQNDEAKWIVSTVTDLKAKGNSYRDIAILYRINEMARALESAFAKSGIPYRVLGSQRFYDRKEIRDMVAYLHVTINPSDDQRLKRIVNEPKRGIGNTTIAAVEELAHLEGTSMFQIMLKADQYVALGRAANKLMDFANLILEISREDLSPSKLISALFIRTGYRDMLVAGGEVEKPRIDAVEEFVTAASDYEERSEEPSLIGFMEEVALVSDVDKYDADADAVVLMTIHSAKGLEFPIVFIPGFEEGVFPGIQAMDVPSEMSEERRLAYVAITRAKKRLIITFTAERMLYGRTSHNALSRFVQREIPKDLVFSDSFIRTTPRPTWQTGGYPRKPMANSELNRRVEPTKPRTATSFGIDRFPVGARVSHPTFGAGTIESVRDMGGDILYTVHFDDGATKKLMATYARLKKL